MQSNETLEIKDFKMEEARETIDVEAIAVPLSTPKGDDTTTRNSMDAEVAKMPPPTQLVPLETAESRPPSSIASDKEDDEILRLQVLSARSSTPFNVQALCCTNANCEVGTTDSTTVSPVKEEETQLLLDENKNNIVERKGEELHRDDHLEGKKYSRSDLMNIRDEMMIVRPECLGSTKLKRLYFVKSENGASTGSGNGNRNKNYRSSNPPNDLMPSFFKRKTGAPNGNVNTFTYDNFKCTDTNPFSNHNDGGQTNNHRRIGSGRLSNRDINWDYIPEEDPEKDNLPEFFNTKDTINSGKQQRNPKKYELDDNSNYVKRVINSVVGESSFRSGGLKNSNNSSSEERYSNNNSSTNTNNKSDEPEWFSCGPTSRLDTIELCGFDESDQQQIRLEIENTKPKCDVNNNREEMTTGGGGHKEKKHLAFQFDDFSTRSGKSNTASKANSSAGGGNRMPSSKFLPLFNATKNRQEEQSKNQHSSQSLNDFFKRNDMPPVQKEQITLTNIPSVDEIEARWRTQQQQNESKSKTTPENFRNNSENFKKMLNQLNQQQNAGGVPVTSSPPQQQPQQSNQQAFNLFNNENLSNFIKQRNLQQQLLQKQQQQAAFAQLQLNAILNRPDAQVLLLSLARGEISKHGLIVQLANPALSQADREAITAVLTFSAAGQYHNQLAINNNHQQQQHFIANQLQNLALLQQVNKNTTAAKKNVGGGFQGNAGGTGGGGSNVRTYSQEELQSHANYILHNAMMKKKMEEQTNLGVQKILQLQNAVLNSARGNDPLTGSKNQQQQHQQQQQHNQQRQRKISNAGHRGNPLGRRRSTSSTSSNATVNGAQIKLASDLEFRQLEQRRNTIATTTVGADEFLQISQRI